DDGRRSLGAARRRGDGRRRGGDPRRGAGARAGRPRAPRGGVRPRQPAGGVRPRRLARGALERRRPQPLDAARAALAMATHEQLQAWDTEHVIHPWSFAGPSLLLVRGEGSSYFDAEGRDYLDALGGIQLCEIGHGRGELAAVAAAQMAEL